MFVPGLSLKSTTLEAAWSLLPESGVRYDFSRSDSVTEKSYLTPLSADSTDAADVVEALAGPAGGGLRRGGARGGGGGPRGGGGLSGGGGGRGGAPRPPPPGGPPAPGAAGGGGGSALRPR